MCGIVGYNGSKKAVDILLDGLSRLEYRGYDSAGVAVRDKDKEIQIFKAKGKLENLREKLEGEKLKGTCGIGHTRWATHGEPRETNAHPHNSSDNVVSVVHNGIIAKISPFRGLFPGGSRGARTPDLLGVNETL